MVEGKKTIGINIACTGNYTKYVYPLVESVEKFFLPGFHKNYYLYSDQEINLPNTKNFWCDLRWPFISLFRYQLIGRNDFDEDYMVYMDADLKVLDYVHEDILEDMPNGIFGVKHLFMDRPTLCGSTAPDLYEKNPTSAAYVPPNKRQTYCLSGFHGGTREAFLRKCEAVTRLALTDFYNNGYIATAHDESYLNRYFIDVPPKILPPKYCCFEAAPEMKLINDIKVLALQKNAIKENESGPSYDGVRNLPKDFDFMNCSPFWWRD